MTDSPFQPGELWGRLQTAVEHALKCGALRPIETEQQYIEDQGVRFAVRRVSSLTHKPRPGTTDGHNRAADPFLPYEQDLFVADVGPEHVALLNKFNVLQNHLLIVTRAFEHQETLLSIPDFEALRRCMREFNALGFYNGGEIAGASQPHKHLQMVPLPLGDSVARVPMERLFPETPAQQVTRLRDLPFNNAFMRLSGDEMDDEQTGATRLHQCYRRLYAAVGLKVREQNPQQCQSAPYNVVLTRRWILLVPRSRECFNGISVNALGYAGSLVVRDQQQVDSIRQARPMQVLREVSLP